MIGVPSKETGALGGGAIRETVMLRSKTAFQKSASVVQVAVSDTFAKRQFLRS